MKEHDRAVATGLVILLLLLWLGFLLHVSPRFAGSLWGGVLGVCGALLMLVPLTYLIVKRIPLLKKVVIRRVSMRTLLTWHIYAGIVGPILAILHTGHKFVSPLGIALTAMTLIVVLSGFVGRYLMSRFSQTIREKKELLTRMEVAYRTTAGQLAAHPEQAALLRPFARFWPRLVAGFVLGGPQSDQGAPVAALRTVRLAQSMADLEYAVKTHELFKRVFHRWLKFHIVISVVLYALLALHVWSGIYFGLRWLP